MKYFKSYDDLMTTNGVKTRPLAKKKRYKEERIMEVTLDNSKSALIPMQVGNNKVSALIDTGASRCCINEEFFKTIPNQKLIKINGLRVRTTTGGLINILGKTKVTFQLGDEVYTYNFIVCRGIQRTAILGLDFMRDFRIGTSWTHDKKFTLCKGEDVLVESIQVYFDEPDPVLYTDTQIRIPPRTLIGFELSTRLGIADYGEMLEVTPTPEFKEKHPNLQAIPMVHKPNGLKPDKVPYSIANLTEDFHYIESGEVLAELKPIKYVLTKIHKNGSEKETSEEIYEISENSNETDNTNSPTDEDKDKDSKEDSNITFITSPAHVSAHRKVKLQNYSIKEQTKNKFKELCMMFEDIFSKSSQDIGHTPLITMEIDTGDNPPICQKPYSLALKHVEWVQKELEILEKAGVIERSMSPWASPIVIVPKKSEPGEPPRRRMCVDYRMLNSLSPPVEKAHSKAKGVLSLVPLPKIDEIYAKLKDSKVYSALDMRSGYFHIELSEDAKPKTAFVVGGPHGAKYQHNRCPFGLSQAPAYFQALVNQVLIGVPFAFGYLDDILIFSPNEEVHLQHLEIVFQRLRKANLKLKASKCNFFKQHIQYLGHIVSGEGVEPLPEKLEAVKKMPAPTTPKGVRQFLGLVGYYRKFIPRFADIARPLTNLTKLDVDFDWTSTCQDTFQLLKDMLLKEPILKYPDPEKPYTLFTDASKYAWACVLTQEYEHEIEGKTRKILHPICYASGLFKGSQINWATLTKEAYAIYMAVKKLTYYLADANITLRSDHLPLKKFLNKNTLNTNVNNWAVEISPYKIKFEYIKGIKNTLADTMSRLITITPDIKPDPEPEGQEFGYHVFEDLLPIETAIESINALKEEVKENNKKEAIPDDVEPILDLSEDQIHDVQIKDKFIKSIINKLLSKKLPKGSPYYFDGKLVKKYVFDNKQRFETTVVAPNCAALLLRLAHDELGHNGSARTYMLLKRNYYWKGMKSDINQYVKQCKECQKHNIQPVPYVKGHFTTPRMPMEFISMDLIGEFNESSRGNKYALTVICMHTGYTWCVPIKSKHASRVIRAYLDNVYAEFGGSRKILSDNGSEFKNQYFENVAKTIGVKYKVYSPPFHPQSNGRIEGFHKFLKACMAKHITKDVEWDEVIPLATAAYNFFPNEHSRESPFFLMFGRDPIIPLTNLLEPKVRYLGSDENILSLEALKKIYFIITENLKIARQRMDKKKHPHPSKLKTEDMVMIKTHVKGQFEPVYKGYYRIVSFKGNQVEVRNCKTGYIHCVHISDVKYVLPVDAIISQLPDTQEFKGRMSTLNLDPHKVPDLKWELSSTLNTKTPIINIQTQSVTPQFIEMKPI